MLGYKGRTGRRDFFAGCALILIGTLAVSMAIKPLMALTPSNPSTLQVIVVVAALNLLAVGVVLAWVWGWTVLATRRARDAGLPAWVGVLSLIGLMAAGTALANLPPLLGEVVGWGLSAGWIVAAGALPSKKTGLAEPALLSQTVIEV